MAKPAPLTLAHKIVAKALHRDPDDGVMAAASTSYCFVESVKRLEACRDLLARIDTHFDLEEFIPRKDIDRVFAAVDLPTSLDQDIEHAEAELAALKQQREEYLK